MLTLQRTADTAFAGIAMAALPVLTEVTGWLSQNAWAFGVIAAVIGVTMVAAFVAWAASAWAVVAPLLANPITWIVLGVVALIAALVLLVMNWDKVVAWVSEVWGGFVNWAGEAFAGLGSWFTSIWSGISSWFMGALSGFGSWWTSMWGGFFNWVGEIFGGFGNWMMSIWSGISGWFMGALGAFGSWWSGLWAGVVSWATGVLNGFLGFVGSIPGAIMAGLAWLANLAGVVGGFFASMAAAAWGKAMELVGWVSSLPGMIVGALGNLGGLLLGAGQSIIQGFLDGLTAGFEAVKGFVGGIADWIAANKGPKAYDEALLIPAGGWIMGGLEKGLRSEIPALEKTLEDITAVVAVGAPSSVGLGPVGDVAGSVTAAASASGYGPAPVGSGVVNNIEVNNPVPEPAGASITGALSKAAYLGLDGGE